MKKGSKLVLKTVEAIANETVSAAPQKINSVPKQAPKIYKETCKIDWTKNANEIYDFIRGLNPYPAAWTDVVGEQWKIFKIKPIDYKKHAAPGTVLTDHKTSLIIKTNDSWVEVHELQLPGKKRMLAEDLLRGNPLAELDSINP